MHPMSRGRRAACTLSSLILLLASGCGGGGDGASRAAAVDASSRAEPARVASATDVAPGPGYYVDAADGDDSNPGSFEAPWKSLGKLSSARLSPGMGVYLRCGRTWHESLKLTWTQLVDGNVIAGYGSECATSKATISGADDFSGGWSRNGSVWSRRLPDGTARISRLFVNGTPLRIAQWPNFGGIGHEYALSSASSPSSSTQLQAAAADLAALVGQDLAGAIAQVRSVPYAVEQRTVARFEPAAGVLVLDPPTSYPMQAGGGYVLQDKRWMLDAPGEFFQDTAAGMLYVIPPDAATQADLNPAVVEGSVRDTALTVVNRANLQLKNLALVRSRIEGLFVWEAPGAVVETVEASGNGRNGIRVSLGAAPAGARGATIRNCTVADNGTAGIDAAYAKNVDVVGNRITDTGTLGHADGSAAALLLGDGGLADRNIVRRTALTGIRFSGTGGTKVTRNDVVDYCVRLSDCGGIYTWNGPDGAQRTVDQSSLVEGNRVWNATADLDGAVGGSADVVVGIYLDDLSLGTTVRGNLVANTAEGIYVHNGSRHLVTGNAVWLTRRAALWANMNYADVDHMTGNVFSGNQLVPLPAASGAWPAPPRFTVSDAVWFSNSRTGFASLGHGGNDFSGNQIVQLTGASVEAAWVRSATDSRQLTAAGWKEMNPADGWTAAPATFALYSLMLGPELLAGGDFTSSLSPWGAAIASPGLGGRLAYVPGADGCDGGCASFTASGPGDMLNSPGFGMTAGALHVLGFRSAFAGTARIRPWIGRNASPWDPVTGGFSSGTPLTGSAGDRLRYEGFFVPTTGEPARTNLQLATYGVDVLLDTVSVRRVTGYTIGSPADWSALVLADRDAARTVDCGDLGWPAGCAVVDVDGNAVAMPATVAAGVGRMFLRANSSWRR